MHNQKLRAARDKKRWTIETAAEKVGVSWLTYSRWEKGTQKPHPTTLDMLCKAFNLPPEELGFILETGVSTAITGSDQPAIPSQLNSIVAASSTNMLSIGVLALSLAQNQYHWTSDELRLMIEQEIKRLDEMKRQNNEENISRRQALSFLASLPIALPGIAQAANFQSIATTEEALPFYVVGIPSCWRMYFSGGLEEVKQVLPNYLAHLSMFAQQASHSQQHFAALASQAHQLGYLLALQNQDFNIAQTHVKQALEYANTANDANLQVASLIRQANLFFAMKRPIQTLQKYQLAIQNVSNASPLLTGQAYIGLAEAYARLGQKQEALRYRVLAEDSFPAQPEADPHFEYTHFNHFTRINFEGLMYLHLGQPKEAWLSFAQIDKNVPSTLVPQRVELLSRQALTSVALGDLEQSCKYIESATTAALKIGSDLRYSEAIETYEQMLSKWPHERRVKALEELFRF